MNQLRRMSIFFQNELLRLLIFLRLIPGCVVLNENYLFDGSENTSNARILLLKGLLHASQAEACHNYVII